MMQRSLNSWHSLITICLLACGSVPQLNVAAAEETFFESSARRILKEHCFHCHGDDGHREGNLDLRLKRLMIAGGDSGPAIVPGQAEQSLVLERILAGDMPPGDDTPRLNSEEIATIQHWIESGAATQFPEPEGDGTELAVTRADTLHWSFQPISKRPLPAIANLSANPHELRNGIDVWILARLANEGFTPAPPASRATLIRRLTIDLTGLPPAPERVDQFLADTRPDAYERLVDELLASPAYGERWGRHWLDVAGYADSEGVTDDDTIRAHAFHYRDYVIRSLNANKPWRQFLTEQIAGDEQIQGPLENLTPDDVDRLTATGFLRMAPDGTGGKVDNPNLARNEVIADTLKTVSSSVLGLTVGCAQCHSHRYDPITLDDYYAFRAIFEPALNWKAWRTPKKRLVSLYTDADREVAAKLEDEARAIEKQRTKRQSELIEQTFESELAKLPEEIRAGVRVARETAAKERSPEQKALLKKHPSVNVSAGSLYLYDKKAADELKKMADEAKAVRERKPQEQFVRALTEVPGQIPVSHVFARGDFEQPKQEVPPRDLTVVRLATQVDRPLADSMNQSETTTNARRTSGRRLAFAKWLTDPRHPLTARVLVNRIWMHHMGQGLVATPDDFGLLGESPSHPELLDWLARELIQNDWDIKRLHRLIVNSAAYRRSHLWSRELAQHDPDNRLWGARLGRRMDAEVLRDSILYVSGQLNRKPFGPPVPVMANRVGKFVIGIENLNAGRPGPVLPMHGEDLRRSVYVQVRRSRPLAVLDTFDLPAMTPNCIQRPRSTVTTQSLMMMNSEFVLQSSGRLATRVYEAAPDSPPQQIERLWHLALSRSPEDTELAAALDLLDEQQQALADKPVNAKKSPDDLRHMALSSLCQAILTSNEFLYVD